MAINWLGKAITAVKQFILLLISGMSRQSGEIRRRDRKSGYSVSPGGSELNDTVFGIYWDTKCSGSRVYLHVKRLHFISQ